jgi:membrane-bound lytic murein transglycosylase D
MPRNVRQPKPPSDLPSWMANLKLPSISIRWNKKLIDYLIFYHDTARGKAILRSWFRKKGRFEKMIARTLKRHRLPQFLVYVAMIESGFRPDCRSYAGAAGLWQFMPFGGRIYDLAYNYWIDERRNPERATRAAALYLRDLYVRFGSWHLALAAYNAGYGAVLRSVRRFNTNDYWKLCQLESGLPYATTNYVPKVLAVAIAGKNPAVFGLQNVKKDHPWQYDVVTVRRPVRLRRIAKAAGVKAAAIEHLNPELRRHRVPPGYKSFQIRIPAGTKKTYLARAPKLRLLPRRHTLYEVRFGEDLSTIAARFNTSRATLRKLNGIRSTTEVLPGLQILVPPGKRKSASHAARGGSTAEGSAGDSDKTIVAIPARPPSAPPGWKRVFYKVTAADTLARLTRAFGVKKRQLLRWNNLSAHAKLHSGIILQVYANPKKDLSRIRLLAKHKLEVVIVDSPAFRVAHLKNRGLKRIVYKARKRDTIRKLSRRFGLSMGSIARLNNISRFSKLKPGQKLVIYVKAKKKRSQKRGQKRKNRK